MSICLISSVWISGLCFLVSVNYAPQLTMVESRNAIVDSSFAGKVAPGGSHTDLVVHRDTQTHVAS